MDNFKKTSQRFRLIVTMIVSVLTVTVTMTAIWTKFQDAKIAHFEAQRNYEDNLRTENMLLDLKAKNDSISLILSEIEFPKRLANSSQSSNINQTQLIYIANKVEVIESSLIEVKENHRKLKSSLKPTEIEDLLTIPRLQDEVKIIRDKLDDLESDLIQRQKSFEASIRSESKASNQSTSLILIVLIPLVINFLYTVWKDLKESKKPNTENTTANI